VKPEKKIIIIIIIITGTYLLKYCTECSQWIQGNMKFAKLIPGKRYKYLYIYFWNNHNHKGESLVPHDHPRRNDHQIATTEAQTVSPPQK
jgi:hypothetical protein